jgi:hypothetical protein
MSAELNSGHDFPSPGVANRRVAAIAIGLMAMMLGAVGMLLGFYVWQLPERALPPPQQLPAPQVRTEERLLRQQLEAAQRERLSGYRWEDQQKNLIGIPIERAMQVLAGRGAKAYDPLIAPGTIAPSPGPDTAAALQNPQVRVPSSNQPMSAEPEQAQP